MENKVMTPMAQLIEFMEAFEKVKFRDSEKEYWLMKEKIENQMAYNAGFSFAHKKCKEKFIWSHES
jgi:hypothetical protein